MFRAAVTYREKQFRRKGLRPDNKRKPRGSVQCELDGDRIQEILKNRRVCGKEMGGAATKEMMKRMDKHTGKGGSNRIEKRKEDELEKFQLPIKWSTSEKGAKSSITIGLPRISISSQPK